jgi:hypothetical protein
MLHFLSSNYFDVHLFDMLDCWTAPCMSGRFYTAHKNKDSLYGRRSLESGKIEQIVYIYRASPTVRSIDFIIQMHHSQRSTPQVDMIGFAASSPKHRDLSYEAVMGCPSLLMKSRLSTMAAAVPNAPAKAKCLPGQWFFPPSKGIYAILLAFSRSLPSLS